MDESTRTVEVIRVGTIQLDAEYPGKQIVRLRDISELYEGGQLKGLAEAKDLSRKYTRGKKIRLADHEGKVTEYKTPDGNALPGIFACLPMAVEDLHDRLKGKRLAGINVNIWDQISGAYLGPYNTDRHGTLILPTDREFVEVLQWQLAGGGYSDCFNGEPAAGMPGLFFYFPANEGSGSTIKSFSGVSGQQATLPANWDWYGQGFFARPAIKVPSSAAPLQLTSADPIGRRSFQFLWFCKTAPSARTILSYAEGAFKLNVTASGKLEGILMDQVSAQGPTTLQPNIWYLIQINTEMVGGWNPNTSQYLYRITMYVYLGGTLELSVVPSNPLSPSIGSGIPGATNLVNLNGVANDGFDEIRNLNRWLYSSEIVNYATFLKNGRVPGKSQGSLGSPSW